MKILKFIVRAILKLLIFTITISFAIIKLVVFFCISYFYTRGPLDHELKNIKRVNFKHKIFNNRVRLFVNLKYNGINNQGRAEWIGGL
ncbi:hypothetical protein BTI679_60400 (plasmid) [Bacillus wiedmannii]|nr:hypothetical protein BTI679_60400 [Bacillus wiedmannii]